MIGAATTAVTTLWVSQRQLNSVNVITERAKWRSKIRDLANDISSNEETKIWIALALNTNPSDGEDKKIVDLAYGMLPEHSITPEQKELVVRLSLLLKHDWERAKIEGSIIPWFAGWRANRKPFGKFSAIDYKKLFADKTKIEAEVASPSIS